MSKGRTERIARSLLISFTAVLAAFIVRYSLDPLLLDNAPFILFYGAILLAAWYGGWQYGILATITALLLTVHFFIEPRHEFDLSSTPDSLTLMVHLFTSGLGIFLIEHLRDAQRKAREEAQVRKEAEEALRQSEARLLEAQESLRLHAEQLERRVALRTEELTQSLRFMEEFLYSMAHDLRAPVRAVKGFTEALVQDYASHLDETARDYGQRIELACERMDRLILELLEYGRLSHTQLELTPVPLQALLRSVIEHFKDEIAERGAEVQLASLPETAIANEIALRQIFRNLISNSIKYVPPDRKPQVRIWTESTDDLVRVCVQDNGIGIPPQFMQKIFKPFQRLHTQDQFPGVGMGLAIARLCAERMGARLQVTSTTGSGSCFCLETKKTRENRLISKPDSPRMEVLVP